MTYEKLLYHLDSLDILIPHQVKLQTEVARRCKQKRPAQPSLPPATASEPAETQTKGSASATGLHMFRKSYMEQQRALGVARDWMTKDAVCEWAWLCPVVYNSATLCPYASIYSMPRSLSITCSRCESSLCAESSLSPVEVQSLSLSLTGRHMSYVKSLVYMSIYYIICNVNVNVHVVCAMGHVYVSHCLESVPISRLAFNFVWDNDNNT